MVPVWPGVLLLGTLVLASIDIRRSGWLDRVVQYKKAEFLNEVRKIVPVKINATIIPEPAGYKDSDDWDYESVSRLLLLLRHSEAAAPVERALRRMMRPNRRILMSMAESFKKFPSLIKQSPNEFYYDVGSAEDYEDEPMVLEKGVIIVTNPVEARLPSAQISVELLKEILLSRAIAARQMPSTTASAIPWTPMNKTYPAPNFDGGAAAPPGGEPPADAPAGGDAPADAPPGGDAPGGDAPGGDAPADAPPGGDDPGGDAPADAPADDAPAEDPA